MYSSSTGLCSLKPSQWTKSWLCSSAISFWYGIPDFFYFYIITIFFSGIPVLDHLQPSIPHHPPFLHSLPRRSRNGHQAHPNPRQSTRHTRHQRNHTLVALLPRSNSRSKHPDNAYVFCSDWMFSWERVWFFLTFFWEQVILIWRIWKVEKRTQVFLDQIEPLYQSYHLRNVIHVIAESGAFYTTCVVITFIVSAIKSNALYPVSNVVSIFACPSSSTLNALQTLIVTGISFNAILARSSERRIQHFTKVGAQQCAAGAVLFGNLPRTGVVELATIESEAEADRASSRDNLNSVKVTKLTTTTSWRLRSVFLIAGSSCLLKDF